ncbi:LysR family transcriptional regulator [Pollutimonas harenae]|uniref:LysR family transcriptional regulator n=1 Tax=Pollutimonas harenae TaxID=657015 RepID=UPI001FD688A7|nr:LysR family transcriptional regulator [Pollutimonas harenae]
MKRNFSFHDLRIFHTVISEGGTRQASRSLHLSQPAIIKAVQATGTTDGDAIMDWLRNNTIQDFFLQEGKLRQ